MDENAGIAQSHSQAIAIKEYHAHLALAGRTSLATYTLIGANVILFVAAALGGAGVVTANPDVLQTWGTNYGPLTTNGEWWRLLSSMFLHFGILHLALNMWALFVGGRLTERLFGSAAFVLIYLTAGLAGSLGSLLWNPAVNSAGASGAIFGIYGAMLAFFLRKDSSIPTAIVQQQRASGLVFIGFNLMNGFSHQGIDNAAHIGGLVAGFTMGLVMARPLAPEARIRTNSVKVFGRGIALALLIVVALFLGVRASPRASAEEQAFRRDMVAMGKLEQSAQSAFKDAVAQLQHGTYTPAEFAQRLESDVLPRWTTIQETYQRDRLPDNSKLKPLSDLLADYSDTRLEAFKLFDSGARTGRSADYQKARDKLELGQMDLKLMKDLDKKK